MSIKTSVKAMKPQKAKGKKPKANANKPIANIAKPKVNADKSEDNVGKPKVKTDKPIANIAKPKVNADKLKVKTDKPKTNVGKPKVKTDKPKTNVLKPKGKNDKPKSNVVKPKVKTNKPKVSVNKPKADKPLTIDNNSDEANFSGSENGETIQDEKQLSSEVSDLLATLRKEHGIEEPISSNKAAKQKGSDKKTKTDTNDLTTEKDKKKKLKKQTNEATEDNKKGNKKRKLAEVEAVEEEGASPAKKTKKKKKADAKASSTEGTTEEATEETGELVGDDIQIPVKDHHLKNATPVFIANLALNTKYAQLKAKLEKYGKILAIHIRTNSGRAFMRKEQLKNVPYLIAFAYFAKREAAETCLSLDGSEYKGRTIRVDLDNDLSEKVAPKNTVVVGNLKYAVTEEILREVFECCGTIRYIRTLQCDRGCKGIAYVCFESADSVGLAMKLNKTDILNREIRVERYIAKKKAKAANEEKSPVKGKAGKGGKVKGKKAKDGKIIKEGKKKEFVGAKSTTKKTTPLKKKKKAAMSKEKKLAKKIAPKKKEVEAAE